MKILITGSNGLLGSALVRKCKYQGIDYVAHTREDCDLLNGTNTWLYLAQQKENGVDTVVHCAAKVGGVLKNALNHESMFLENVRINNNVLESCSTAKIPNLVNVLSSCLFSTDAKYPLTLDQIFTGPPHETQEGYAYSKRLSYEYVRYYRKVFGANWFNVIPTNIFGVNDNFELDGSHVIPALIRKAEVAKETGGDFVIWGDGQSLRQFIDSDDLAQVILNALDNWKEYDTLFAANPKEYKIAHIVSYIAEIFGISEDKVIYDSEKPSGRRRMVTVSDIPTFPFTPLRISLLKAVNWYRKNKDNARK